MQTEVCVDSSMSVLKALVSAARVYECMLMSFSQSKQLHISVSVWAHGKAPCFMAAEQTVILLLKSPSCLWVTACPLLTYLQKHRCCGDAMSWWAVFTNNQNRTSTFSSYKELTLRRNFKMSLMLEKTDFYVGTGTPLPSWKLSGDTEFR